MKIAAEIDLNYELIHHPAATFIVRVTGNSMTDAGIFPGDLLIVDKSLEPEDGRIVIAAVHGEFHVKRIRRTPYGTFLCSEAKGYGDFKVTEDYECWGVVTQCIHEL